MVKRFKYKWLVIVIMLGVFYIADFAVLNIPVSRRSICVGLALDMDGEEVEISTQVILAKQGGASAGPNNYVVYSAKAKDVPATLQKISEDTGRKVSLAHVSSIIIGYDVLQNGNFDFINYFFKNGIVGDLTIMVMTKGKGKDIFKAKVPVGEAISYQIGNVSSMENMPLGKNSISAEKFMENYLSGSGENWLPVIELKENEPSDDQSKENVEKADLIVFSGACMLSRTGINGFIEKDASDGLSLIFQDIESGTVQIKSRENKDISIRLLENRAKIKYKYDEKKVEIKFFMKTVRAENMVGQDAVEKKMNEIELKNFQNEIIKKINTAFMQGLNEGYDIFNFRNEFAIRYPKEKDNIYKDDFLKNLRLEFKFDIIQR